MKTQLKSYISLVIENRLNKDSSDNFRQVKWFENLGKYIKDAPPYYYVHFSDLNKVGINPRYNHSTPFGIYAWVLNSKFFEILQSNPQRFFATDRPCVHILESSVGDEETLFLDQVGPAEIKFLVEWLRTEGMQYIPNFPPSLAGLANKPEELLRRIVVLAREETARLATSYPSGKLYWEILEVFCNKDYKLWRKILMQLGYQGVVDISPEHGIIYPSEPMQAVYFSKSFLTQITTLQNPSSNEMCGKGEDPVVSTIAHLAPEAGATLEPKFIEKYWPKIMGSSEKTKQHVLISLLKTGRSEFESKIRELLKNEPMLLYVLAGVMLGPQNKLNSPEFVEKFWNTYKDLMKSRLLATQRQILQNHFKISA